MKTELTQKSIDLQKVTLALFLLTLLCVTETYAQTFQTETLKQQIQNIADPAYKVLSFVMGGIALISFFRNAKDMINGDKDAMQRFGGVLVIAALWFFLVPQLMKWMFDTAGSTKGIGA